MTGHQWSVQWLLSFLTTGFEPLKTHYINIYFKSLILIIGLYFGYEYYKVRCVFWSNKSKVFEISSLF